MGGAFRSSNPVTYGKSDEVQGSKFLSNDILGSAKNRITVDFGLWER